MNKLRLYHGTSNQNFTIPDIDLSRSDVDFGEGFYTTEDKMMSKKWAVHKRKSFVLSYDLKLDGLNIYNFSLDLEWLKFVERNRHEKKMDSFYEQFDVLIGPTADDKLFNTIQQYEDGLLSSDDAIRFLNIANYNNQIVLKTQKAIDNLSFVDREEIMGKEKQELRELTFIEKRESDEKLKQLIQEMKSVEDLQLKHKSFSDYKKDAIKK